MNELQIINLDSTDISTWNFPAIKAELQKYLSEYEGLVYTDETIKDAKKDKAELNKAKKVIEDARKAYKTKCLEPYEAIEPKIKELTGLIEKRRLQIDETVKEYEARQKAAKEKEVREYYDRISGPFGADADRIYQKIFDTRWINATTSTAKYREGVQSAVASVIHGLEEVKALDTPFADTLIDLYLETLSMEAVIQKNDELKAAAGKAGLAGLAEDTETAGAAVKNSSNKTTADPADGTVIRIHASQSKIDQICDFMKAIGVDYEIL